MPYRQVIAGRVRIPVVSNVVIPFQATTTFEDYEINTGRPIAFELPLPDRRAEPDSLRALRRRAQGLAPRGAAGCRATRPTACAPWDYAGRWPGGRFELHRPSNATLGRYDQWPDSLSLEADPGGGSPRARDGGRARTARRGASRLR